MTFSDIHILWLFWSVPAFFLVCVWGMRKRAHLLHRFASSKGLAAITPDVSTPRRWLKIGLVLAALLLMVISLAGPRYGYHWQEVERKGVDIIIALDCSKSMLAKDVKPTRLDRAKREVFDLLAMLQGDRVGLVAFAGTAFLQCPLTLDYEAFYLFLNTLTPDFLPVGGTNLTEAVNTAMSGFNREDASEKAIILITDGEETGDGAVAAAQAAGDADIKLFCIGVGGEDGVPIPSESSGYVKDSDGNIILSKLDASTLKKMAAVTGGAYVRSVAGDMDLDAIYVQHIRGEMDAVTLAQQKKKVLENRYQWFLSLAVLALIIERCLPLKKTIAVGVIMLALLAVPNISPAGELKENLKKGAAAYEKGAYDAARDSFITSQLLAPDRPEIYYNLGNTLYKTGDYDAALKNYEQALDTEDASLRQKAHYNMGNAYFRKGQFDEAIKQYEAALKLDSEDPQAKDNLEFARKIKEQQPPSSSQEDQKNSEKKDDKQQKDGDKKDQSKDTKEPSKKEDTSSQEPDKQDKADKPKAEQPPAPNENQSEEKDAGPQPDSAPKDPTSGQMKKEDITPEDKIQAEKMLNRLKDMPGRAMMPTYQKQQVEKDW